MRKNNFLLLLLLLVLFIACNKKNYIPNSKALEFNKCFGLNFSDDLIYEDIIVNNTIHNNQNIYKSINDSLYEWKITRGEVEYVIDTFYCDIYKRGRMPKLYFESEKYLVYLFKCGSPCWYYDIYNMQEQKRQYNTGISFLDTFSFKTATIIDNDFVINDFNGKELSKYPIKGIDTCLENALPLLHLNDLDFRKDSLRYVLSCMDGNEFEDVIIVD